MDSSEIRKFREEFQLTQKQMSEITGVTVRAVQSWEQGQRTIPQSGIMLLEIYRKEYKKNNSFKINKPLDLINEPTEYYGIDYKELYLREKQTVDLQNKYIASLELQLNNKRKAG